MNKLLVAVFDTESQAFEGLTAMKKLHDEGSITIYANAVIAKDENGKVEIKQEADDGPIGTAIGMLTGSLMGMMVAGPAGMATGLAVGTGVGALTGSIFDFTSAGVDISLLDEVAGELNPGKSAVLVEAEETWTAPIDTRMSEMGAVVFRHNKIDLVDEHFTKMSDEMDAEMNELVKDMKDANDETKASIQKQIDKLKEKSNALNESISKKRAHNKSAMKSKIDKLKRQYEKADEKRKARLKKNMKKIKTANKKNKAKLKKASDKLSKLVL